MHDEYPLDLGKTMDGPEPMPTSPAPNKKEKYYPSFYITLEDGEDPGIPKEGIMEIKYRVRTQTERTDKDGQTTCSYDIDVMAIHDIESEEEELKEESGGEALDRYRNEGGKE